LNTFAVDFNSRSNNYWAGQLAALSFAGVRHGAALPATAAIDAAHVEHAARSPYRAASAALHRRPLFPRLFVKIAACAPGGAAPARPTAAS
jgi:hypothetical protein